MLMLTGAVVEFTSSGAKHMLLFTSPQLPGAHYKVEVDPATAARVRTLINHESMTVELTDQMAAEMLNAGESPEEDPKYDPFGRN